VNLDRPELAVAFREFAAGGHGVLIGAPGVGKTYLLRAMARELQGAPDSRCLFLPVDRMPFESDSDLRAEFESTGSKVPGDIISFLEDQAQQRHGYLIVDALDAVRGDRPRAYVLGLVRRVIARLADSWTRHSEYPDLRCGTFSRARRDISACLADDARGEISAT
jgi:SpoVK/Ycf46/Vps4 family AAA+-type ATPase